MVAEYQLAAHPQVEFDLRRMPGGRSSSGHPAARTPLIATLVAVVLLAGGYLLFRYSPRAAEAPGPPPPAPVATPKPATPPPEPGPTASGATTAVPGVNPAAGVVTPGAAHGTPEAAGATPNPQGEPVAGVNPAAQSSPPPGNPPGTKPASDTDLVLQVAATEHAWVAVDADGKTVLQRVLNPEEVQTLKAHRSFDVTTGNAQAVILTLNGETLKPLGRHGEVKSVHLTREDLKNSAP